MNNLERDDLYTGLTEEMLNPGNSREYSMDKDMMARYLRFQNAVEKGWSEWQKLDTLKREDITELSKNCLDEEGLQTYIAKLEANEAFENFLASEEDLFAIKTNLSEDEIADLFLSSLEECIS